MDKWEYKVINYARVMKEDDLNKLGADGWELVIVVHFGGYQYHFKRRKP